MTFIIFQLNNASCHKAKSINQIFNKIGARTLNWAPQSQDKGFLENTSPYVKRHLSVILVRTQENTIAEVKELSLEYILKFVDYTA